MTSWVYLLSTFTPEALIFESLAILTLICAYTAFWVLRKRRLGAVENEVPSTVVKAYLNELIGEAQGVRTQLFGLLSAESAITQSTGRVFTMPASSANTGPAVDLSGFERKMAEQAAALERIIGEKAILEKDLAAAKSAAPTGKGDAETTSLKEKLANLEARLQEYSIIEDDLANLKRLQQENAQLKAQLAGKGGAAAAPALAANAEPVLAPKPEPVAATPAPAVKLEEPPAAVEPALAAESGPKITEDTPFANLNKDVKESLASTSAPVPAPEPKVEPKATPAPAAAAPVPVATIAQAAQAPGAPATMSADKPPTEKSDEDLIAEFEKMLNS